MPDDILKPLIAPDFFICTTPEMDALERAAADGKHGNHYTNLEQEIVRVHQTSGASHFVRLKGVDAETFAELQSMTDATDADATLAFLYISHLLAPPSPLAPAIAHNGKIDYDDVISKIGWTPQSTAERREMHRRLHDFIRFAERAQVVGTRRGRYIDKHTGENIPTIVESSIWRIQAVVKPAPDSLYLDLETPIGVELGMSSQWTELLTQPATAQYLPMGELLGAIPGNKPSGAWARVIGLALASFWRRQPVAALDSSIQPTRRELLERYAPKTGTVAEVLAANNAQRAIEYWCGALLILADCGFIQATGEATISPTEMRARLPLRFWADQWLKEKVELKPGEAFGNTIVQRVAALPPKPKNKGGRPRKKTAQ